MLIYKLFFMLFSNFSLIDITFFFLLKILIEKASQTSNLGAIVR